VLIHTIHRNYPFNVRSFFTPRETMDIGMGIVLWRGYFQSVRPAIGRMLVNVDISTGTMYKPGNVLDICLELLEKQRKDVAVMYSANLGDRDALKLSRFFSGVRVITSLDRTKPPRVMKRIVAHVDSSKTFTLNQEGQAPRTITIAVCLSNVFCSVVPSLTSSSRFHRNTSRIRSAARLHSPKSYSLRLGRKLTCHSNSSKSHQARS